MLSVRGPGGAGKSALAVDFARRHDLTVANLGDCANAPDICRVLGAALGLPERTRDEEGVVEALASIGFVVLDDVDPVTDALAELLKAWQARIGTRFVVTARRPLSLGRLEDVVEVGGLDGAAALALLATRASGVELNLTEGSSERAEIDRLIELVDALPLGIELVATRLQLLAPKQLIERLERQFDVLSQRSASVERHSAVDACVEWSWSLLSDEEQSVLAQCAIFRAGFSIEDAEAVIEARGWVGDTLDALVETSLIRFDRRAHQFTTYEIVRRFLHRHTQLEPALAARFVAHLRPRFLGAPSTPLDTWTVVKSFDTLLEVAPMEAVRLVTDARQHLWRAGYLPQTIDMLERALELPLEPIWEAKARAALASCFYTQTRTDACDRLLTEAEALVADDPSAPADQVRAHVASMRALRADEVGNPDEAERQFQRALGVLAALEPVHEVHLVASYGLSHLRHGRTEEALTWVQRALHAARNRTSDPALLARTLGWVGHVYLANDEVSRAIAALKEALALFAQADDLVSQCRAEYLLGLCYVDRDEEQAVAAAERSLELAQRGKMATYAATARMLRARILRDETSESEIQRALMLYERFPDRTDVWTLRLLLSVLYVEQNRASEAIAELRELLSALQPDDEEEREWIERYHAVVHLLVDGTTGDAEVSEAFALAAREVMNTGIVSDEQRAQFDNRHLRLRHDRAPLPLDLLAARLKQHGSVPRLTLWDGGDEIELPDGSRVDMRNRHLLRRLLLTLCERRETQPGEHVTVDDLIEAGWPQEAMTYESALRRVYSAIRNLRKLGLEEVVINGEVGYLIAPSIEVQRR